MNKQAIWGINMTVTVNGKQMTLKEYNDLVTESQMTFSKDIVVKSNPLTLKESHQIALTNQQQFQNEIVNEIIPVSYTHLTLPTIYSV